MKTSVWALAIFLVAMLAPAHAAAADDTAFPSYDADDYCSAMLSAAPADTKQLATAKKGCLSGETAARGRLQRVWLDAPQSLKRICLQQQAKAEAQSYTFLSGCMQTGIGTMWLNGQATLKLK